MKDQFVDDDEREVRGKPLGTQALDQMVIFSSYIPTIFGIISLSTAKKELMKGGATAPTIGGLSGMLCVGYSIFFLFGISKRSPDLCKVIMMARLSLGVLFVIGGAFLAFSEDLSRAVIFFCYAAFALPEAYLLFTYGAALQKDMEGGDDAGQIGMVQLSPPSQGMRMSQLQADYGQPPPSFQNQPAQGYDQGGYDQQPPQQGYDQGYGQQPPQQGYDQGGYGGAPPMQGAPASGFGLGPAQGGDMGYGGGPPQQGYGGGGQGY